MRYLALFFLTASILLFTLGCLSTHSHPDTIRKSAYCSVDVMPSSISLSPVCHLNAYCAVHSLYSGLILPLELVHNMSLKSKYDLICALWGTSEQGTPVERIEVSNYFEHGTLYIVPKFSSVTPPQLEWHSNAIYSPITKSPLKGRGEFLSREALPLQNIHDTVFILEENAVRQSELFSIQREQRLQQEGTALYLAQFYLHDGQSGNDHLIAPLIEEQLGSLQSGTAAKAVLSLSLVRFHLYHQNYSAAYQQLQRIEPYVSAFTPALQQLYRFTYEVYCLSYAFDLQSDSNLVEYTQFSQGEIQGE
ncbi:MAG: hypothetical protein K9L66_08730 [Spirochaetaceae bacterium]|nr:hypothetical protein [Spirochaetaceae bacterium]MCF7951578.1 hypothetical protein [Spirochaetaceae bacterium]